MRVLRGTKKASVFRASSYCLRFELTGESLFCKEWRLKAFTLYGIGHQIVHHIQIIQITMAK